MKRTPPLMKALLLSFILAPSLLAQAPEEKSADSSTPAKPWKPPVEITVFGNDVSIDASETVDRVAVFGGNVDIQGSVRDGVFVLDGTVTLGPNASIGKNLVVVGGKVTAHSGARVERHLLVFHGALETSGNDRIANGSTLTLGTIPGLEWFAQWVANGPLLGRPLPHNLTWLWIMVAVAFFINLLVAVTLPRPVNNCVLALEARPFTSFFVGLLVMLLFAMVSFIFVVLFITIPLVFFITCGMVGLTLLGSVALYQLTGIKIGQNLNLKFLEKPIVAVALGTIIFTFFYILPLFGLLIWGLMTPYIIGAATLSIIGAMRTEETLPPVRTGEEDDLTEKPRAGFFIRAAATFIDVVILFVASALTTALIGEGTFPIAFLIYAVVYHTILYRKKGATIGGAILGLRLIRVDGKPLSYSVTLVRSLTAILSFILLGLGFFWAGWDRNRQSWHDKLAGTVVVRMPEGISLL